MMARVDCESARRLIHLRLDGQLGEDDARLLSEHIEGCAHCRRLQGQLEGVDAALREGLGALEVRDPDVAAVRSRVRRARRPAALWTTWLPAAAAFVIVATAVLLAVPGRQAPEIILAAPAMVVSGGEAIHVFEPDQRTAQSRETGTELQEDSVAWGLGGDPIALEFLNGARVGLSNEAVVRIGRTSIDLFKGGLRVDLEDAGDDFSVITPWGEFTGPGSLFMVHSDANGGSARLTVYSGEVTVSSRGTTRVVREGQALTLQPDPHRTITL